MLRQLDRRSAWRSGITLPPRISPVMADDLSLDQVAGRLGKSRRWLQARLHADRVTARLQLQFHHYLGRSPRWDELEYRALRAALIGADTPERRSWPAGGAPLASKSSSGTGVGIFAAPSPLRTEADESEKVRVFPQPATTLMRRMRSAVRSKRRPATSSSSASLLRFRSR